MARDQSVVLRQVQRLADAFPVIEKVDGRWRLTDLGKQVNGWTRAAIHSQEKVICRSQNGAQALGTLPALDERTVLLLVNVQRATEGQDMGPSSSIMALDHIVSLLDR